ncbi:hypothetical protein FACS1894187_02510 [Synergistales bacterium]|nr:hypothetical protein FACS1894187_02510 [Synergistales bacterium]
MTLDNKNHFALVKSNIEKTERAYKTAILIFNDGDYDGAANRTYYALFHAEKALLHMREIEVDRHKQVHNSLSMEFVKNGFFPKDTMKKIEDIQNTRNIADYSEEKSATKEEVELAMSQTKDFLKLAEKFLGTNIHIEEKSAIFSNQSTIQLPKGKTSINAALKFSGLCSKGTLEEIDSAIQSGADVNARTTIGWTALMSAATANPNVKVIKLLIDNGADVNAKDNHGNTALISTFSRNSSNLGVDLEIISLLLDAGADVNARDHYGVTPLMYAAEQNFNPEIIELLLDNGYGADIDAKDQNGWTALMYAAFDNSNPEITSALVNNGADLNARNINGKTALMLATSCNRVSEVTKILFENKPDINARDNTGKTALDHAEKNLYLRGTDILKQLKKATHSPVIER